MVTYLTVLPSAVHQSLTTPLDVKDLAFLHLPHPRNEHPSLFFTYFANSDSKRKTICEAQFVAPPDQRSWFTEEGSVADGRLLMVTPVDPVLLLIPWVKMTTDLNVFRTMDDLLEAAALKSQEPSPLQGTKEDHAGFLSFTSSVVDETILACICDVQDVNGMKVFRYSSEKVSRYLRKKVERIAGGSAVTISRTLTRKLAKEGLMEDGKESLLRLGRLKAACDLVSQYISEDLRKALFDLYDFTELESHSKVQEAPAIPTTSKKAPKIEPVEQSSKKRKQTKSSHGVESLKKVNVSGMAKLSDMFKKTS